MNQLVADKRIKAARVIFKQLHDWQLARKALNYFFAKYPGNEDAKVVLCKVCLVDSLYGTNTKGPVSVAKHILKANIDDHIRRGSVDAVTRIVNWKRGDKAVEILSFASKYCYFHNKKKFPIYDKYAAVALNAILGKQSWSKRCRDYTQYQFQVERIRDGRSMEDIDTFLWLYGLRLALDSGRQDVNKEVLSLYKKRRGLFNQLGA